MSTATAAAHEPVMLPEVLQLLEPALRHAGSVLVDGTLGLGGHAEALLRACPEARLVGVDRDPQALALAGARLAPFGQRVRLVSTVYDEIPAALADVGLPGADAILLDLGVSSLQLDSDERGFAYRVDAPLDMRMNQHDELTAAEILNTYSATDLVDILQRFGEERFARRIVRAIVREREVSPWDRSARLVDVIRTAIPIAAQQAGHPAKKTFQALRIEVNGELAALERAIPAALAALKVGGRMAVLAYHSLEDRPVKQAFAAGATSSAPLDLPVELPGHAPTLRLLTRGAQLPTPAEVAGNSRAASARLRAVERIRAGGSP